MSGIVCCICNHKGGVGKTSLTCNLSVALSFQNKRVLVVDNDPQANSTGILLSETSVIRNSLYELLESSLNGKEKVPIGNCIYPANHKGLYCLPNVEETSGLELEFAEKYPESLYFLRNKIRDFSKENFDFILIDCSPTLSLFVANALYASDCVIVPIDAGSAYSLDGLRKVLTLIESIQQSGNPDLRFLRLLINRVDLRTSVSKVIIDDITERFGNDQVFETKIPINTPFQQSEYLKESIFNHAPTSRGAKAYRKLSKEFLSFFKQGVINNDKERMGR